MKWLSDSIRLDRQLTVKMKSCAAMILEVYNGRLTARLTFSTGGSVLVTFL